jgi:vitamin B12 transporter
MMGRRAFLLLLIFVFLAAATPAVPQDSSPGIFSGWVSDPDGRRIPRAPVTLRDAAGKLLAHTVTDARGEFRLVCAAAEATLTVALPGFVRWSRAVPAAAGTEVQLAVAPVQERVVVTATRTEVPASQLGANVAVITRQQIAATHALRVPELLRTVPGLALVQTGMPGGVTSVFARGAESDHNRVFVDGVAVNEPGGAFDFAYFSALNLDRIEIVRGPQSALFGSDAIGSTIQLFTRRGEAEGGRPHFALSLEGGNHHTINGSASMSGGTGRFDYSAAVSRFLTDNDGVNNAFRNTAFSASFGVALSERARLRAITQGDFGTAGTPGQVLYFRPDTDARNHRGDGVASFNLDTHLRPDWRQQISYGYSRTRYRSLNLFDDPPPFSDFLFDNTNDTRRHRAGYQSDWSALPTQTFTVAFEFEREKGRLLSVFPAFPAFSPPAVIVHRTNVGGVIQHQALLWNRLSLTAGVRVEGSTSFGKEATPRFSAAWTARQGGGAAAFGASKLKFNFGTGIKEPTFLENYSLSFGFMGNPNLAPERVRSFDFGFEQRLAADRAKLEINLFHNRFRDLIAFVNTTFINIGGSQAKGAEVLLEVKPVRQLRGVGSYTYVDSQVTDSQVPASPIIGVGRPLLRRPRHSGSLALLWDWRRLHVSSTTFFVGRRADSDFQFPSLGLTSNPGHVRWDLAAGFRSTHRVTYFVAWENLNNDKYEEVLGYPALGRSVRAGLRWEY